MRLNKEIHFFTNSKSLIELIIILFLIVYYTSVNAQDERVWNGKKCAVCLTYDDALNVHLDNVIPLLDSLGFRATFYIIGYSQTMKDRSNDWKLAAEKGNELGNHTLFHPCEGKKPGREWVGPDYDLSIYTVQRMVDEIKMENILLNILDGKKERTFAYTCGDMNAGNISFVEKIKEDFVAARGVQAKLENINNMDLFNIGCYMINGQTGEELISLAKKAMENNALIVFLFHGVGGEHSINVSLDAHSKLIHFLKQNEKDIWIAPMVEIAKFVTDYRQNKNK